MGDLNLIPSSEMKNVIPGTTDAYWAQLRHLGGGPTYTKLGRKVFYRRGDVESWVEANLHTRTDKPVEA
ncbi:DNA-binding protein [Mycolicibacterium sp. 120270]|uniref:DNA-binding protein n=1 Tax=Mycolicibacterium sp. 120270 TaxID=3090600 RepID=UPI00299D68D1|nr:DNA-binding protein [Mycolicibacterium sp. 120270]MDX1882257.1 DNA-binding protein [Mycolicibacterium sp. 120270]